MRIQTWLARNAASLSHKTVAVTGSTGGLGRALCHYLAGLGASLVLMDRNATRSVAFRDELAATYGVSVSCITVDLAVMASVKPAAEALLAAAPDIFIHNAGAYDIPRCKTDVGYDNVFQINFVSPYYIIRTVKPHLDRVGGRVVVVGSIAHNYSVTDEEDIDFSTRKRASRVYGNAKRYLMFSLYPLFCDRAGATLAVTHPGISQTGITAHYPKLIYALIKWPMRVIFMRPRKACLSILRGVFEECGDGEWIGPCCFDVWGYPLKKSLHTCTLAERARIVATAEQIYARLV